MVGLLSVQHSEANVYSNADLNLLRRLAEHIAGAIADARAFEDLEHYRARLEERIAERTAELEQANREKERLAAEYDVALAAGQPLTLAIVDFDRFKVVNDDLGHTVGDEALRQSASLMRHICRETDLVARIGGEEFALVLPGMTLADATEFCERLRRAVEAHEWQRVHPGLRVTVSIGVAQWDRRSAGTALIGAADRQLYRAKREGRNRVA